MELVPSTLWHIIIVYISGDSAAMSIAIILLDCNLLSYLEKVFSFYERIPQGSKEVMVLSRLSMGIS